MTLTFRQIHPHFFAEAGPVDLRAGADAAVLAEIRDAMDRYAVVLFRGQSFSDDEQLDFARRLDGELHARTSQNAIGRNRLGHEALTDISNLDRDRGGLLQADDRRRMNSLGNRLWHTDASFVDPAGRYSMLYAKVVPDVPADTEFADTRAAYDALDMGLRHSLEGLHVHHSIVYSRETLGFEFTAEEQAKMPGATHPLVRTLPGGRRSIYIASHASRIIEMPLPEGRLLLRELMQHAIQPQFTCRHAWRAGDFVIWDNRATMHRGLAYDDTRHVRELRRVTTLDLPRQAREIARYA